jgi:uncharacterized FlaG/YvyC family protein
MASDGNPVKIPAVSLVQGSRAPTKSGTSVPTGKNLPPAGHAAAAAAAVPAAKAATNPAASPSAEAAKVAAQVSLLNKFLSDSGRPNQFRVDPASDSKLIQEVNPSTGEVIGEYPVVMFPALARGLSISGALIDEHA